MNENPQEPLNNLVNRIGNALHLLQLEAKSIAEKANAILTTSRQERETAHNKELLFTEDFIHAIKVHGATNFFAPLNLEARDFDGLDILFSKDVITDLPAYLNTHSPNAYIFNENSNTQKIQWSTTPDGKTLTRRTWQETNKERLSRIETYHLLGEIHSQRTDTKNFMYACNNRNSYMRTLPIQDKTSLGDLGFRSI